MQPRRVAESALKNKPKQRRIRLRWARTPQRVAISVVIIAAAILVDTHTAPSSSTPPLLGLPVTRRQRFRALIWRPVRAWHDRDDPYGGRWRRDRCRYAHRDLQPSGACVRFGDCGDGIPHRDCPRRLHLRPVSYGSIRPTDCSYQAANDLGTSRRPYIGRCHRPYPGPRTDHPLTRMFGGQLMSATVRSALGVAVGARVPVLPLGRSWSGQEFSCPGDGSGGRPAV